MDHSPQSNVARHSKGAASHTITCGHGSGNFRYWPGWGRSFQRCEQRKKIRVAAHTLFSLLTGCSSRVLLAARECSQIFLSKEKTDPENIMLNSVSGGEFYIWAARFSGVASACDCPQMMAWQRTKETQCHL
jgi:hypothetical protein